MQREVTYLQAQLSHVPHELIAPGVRVSLKRPDRAHYTLASDYYEQLTQKISHYLYGPDFLKIRTA